MGVEIHRAEQRLLEQLDHVEANLQGDVDPGGWKAV